ncbi:MAG: hypothetical protein KME04_03885 [Pleurocapsa minor GSE-CHR-MK-17-07R]|jgi:hypothetical protein|nr:hypothetical protein [Pleurocapsa minor GSE-CHR-MK 17-07R]
MTSIIFRTFAFFLFLLGTACTNSTTAALPPTPTTLRVVEASTAIPETRSIQPVTPAPPTDTPDANQVALLPTDSIPVNECDHDNTLPIDQHRLALVIDYANHVVEAVHEVIVYNGSDSAYDYVVFSVEPNRLLDVFSMASVTVDDDAPQSAELTGRRLTVVPLEPLQPGCSLTVSMTYTLTVPAIGSVSPATQGYFGFGARQFNLGNAFPTVAPRFNGQWITYDPATIGEQVTSPVANWQASITIDNGPANLVLAAPGIVTSDSDGAWQVITRGMRDFAFTLSPTLQMASQVTSNGVTVEYYTYSDAPVQADNGRIYNGPAHALEAASRAVEMFSDLFGQYPHSRLVLVQSEFPDGMEFGGIVYVGGEWFRTYNNSPASYLFLITIHEVAHQWWFARVGSDQANAPWLDEALATYSELIFIEEFYPDLRDWWWDFRVGTFVPADFAGPSVASTVYDFASVRDYINAVYLNGARMLESLRTDIGTEAFFAWLARYAAAGADRIVQPGDIWRLLSLEELAATEATRMRYLGTSALPG